MRDLSELEVPERIKRALRDFASKLRAALPDAEAYLFGSYARGDWLHDSDLDIVVVSRAFEGMDVGRRYALVRALLPPDVSVELLLYTPEEFERARSRSVVLRDAERYWARIC